ncbi:amine oxidase [Thiocapsa marina 5811]|uniref:Amine oxidase n=2 Tax=Thiocapsa marina TaxID=244573 RepID=F9UF42_9GAMM|nr:amine oxidase [Thiocapsa marina 5811]
MARTERIAVVGAGMAGLACARRLADAGCAPVVFDKGRGIGGRLATRRTPDGLQFDHGAQYVTASSTDFQAVLKQARGDGAAALWNDGAQRTDRPHVVGTPGMTGLAKHLGRGLDIRRGIQVTALRRAGRGWTVSLPEEEADFDRVVVTVPAPQLADLLGSDHPISREVAAVRLDPCLTLMAAFDHAAPRPFITRTDPEHPLAWIAQDSSKPGRHAPACWVAQASTAWSTANLELTSDALVTLMLPMLCDRLGTDPAAVRYAVAHRWRHARVCVPLDRPFARDTSGTLYAGGDWCLGPRVEAAWSSGEAIAQDIVNASRRE